MADTENGVIKGVFLGIEDHGLLSSMVYVSGGTVVQGFGGRWLGTPRDKDFSSGMSKLVAYTLDALGRSDWMNLVGCPVRTYHKNYRIEGLGNFLEDRWVYCNDEGYQVGTYAEMTRG